MVIDLLLNMFLLKLSAPYTGILNNTCLYCRMTKWQGQFGLSLALSVGSRSCGRFGVVIEGVRAQQS